METYVYGNAGHITSHRICEGYVFLPEPELFLLEPRLLLGWKKKGIYSYLTIK